jgi:ADP-ribose diphosphatase
MSVLPQILKTTVVARSRLFNIESVDLRFANGNEVNFERLVGQGTGAVLVVPLPAVDQLLLVRLPSRELPPLSRDPRCNQGSC